jgi:ABC-type dipeptide/oligopeptide/nickel transport system permease component
VAIILVAALVLRAGLAYALRRAAGLLATLLVASLIIFTTMQLIPGDPARAILGIQASPAAVAALREQLGLDAPFWWRYGHWLAGLGHGDLGASFIYHQQVGALVAQRLALSLPLTLYALLLSTALALVLGIVAAYGRGRWSGALASGLARLALAVPNFWFGLMLVIPFGIVLHWVPAGGFPGWGAGLGAGLRALTLPAIALALPQAAVLARVLALELRELSGQDFLRTAAAKGAGPLRILFRHALPNALVPVLTILGMQFSFLLAGGVLIENVFFLPGLGRLIFQAIANRDAPVVQSVSLLLVAQVVVVTLLADLAAAAADPRRRSGASS